MENFIISHKQAQQISEFMMDLMTQNKITMKQWKAMTIKMDGPTTEKEMAIYIDERVKPIAHMIERIGIDGDLQYKGVFKDANDKNVVISLETHQPSDQDLKKEIITYNILKDLHEIRHDFKN